LPIERVEQPQPGLDEPRLERNALPVHAHAAARRLLAQAAVREHRDNLAVPPQRKEALARAYDPALQEYRIGRGGKRSQRMAAGGRVGDGRDGQLATAAVHADHRPVRLDERRKERGIRQRAARFGKAREDQRFGHAEAAPFGQHPHACLVGRPPIGCQVGKWKGDVPRQRGAVLEDGLRRGIRQRQQQIDPLALREQD